ncbi:MAG: biopolymer transporter ExbD [Gammaproteobacteria bacterium]|nr:biopolymer transporter ExbD [Gammaproteobacteria bacterium]
MTRIPRGAAQFKWRRQRQEKSRRWPTLNLVALMDVFTILVFFFLVHSLDSAPEAHNALVKLPESVADQQPRDTPVVMITRDNILVQGEAVVAVDAFMRAAGGEIQALRTALQTQLTADAPVDADREVTIMGDRSIPFELLNRVMQTCKRAGYGNISLSVLQRSSGAG